MVFYLTLTKLSFITFNILNHEIYQLHVMRKEDILYSGTLLAYLRHLMMAVWG
jgi:hypothetical protein